MSLVSGTELIKPSEFPVIGVSFIIYHEQLSDTPELVSIRKLRMGPLGSLRLGWSLERPSDWKPPTPYLQEGEGELEIEL